MKSPLSPHLYDPQKPTFHTTYIMGQGVVKSIFFLDFWVCHDILNHVQRDVSLGTLRRGMFSELDVQSVPPVKLPDRCYHLVLLLPGDERVHGQADNPP